MLVSQFSNPHSNIKLKFDFRRVTVRIFQKINFSCTHLKFLKKTNFKSQYNKIIEKKDFLFMFSFLIWHMIDIKAVFEDLKMRN